MSNSNFNITKVTVDPVSQEITNLEINGKAVETGGSNLQVGELSLAPGDSGIFEPDDDYDGFSRVDYEVEQAHLENVDYDAKQPLDVSSLFGVSPSKVEINASEDWDGMAGVDIYPGGLTGYPGEGLEFVNNPSVNVSGISDEMSIEIPRGKSWTGIITLIPNNTPEP